MTSIHLVFAVTLVCVAGSTLAQVYSSHGEASTPVEEPASNNEFITQTVYGFLDFTTTIGNTVMVFSPQSAPPDGGKAAAVSSTPPIQTKPLDGQKKSPDIQPSKTHKSTTQHETKKQAKAIKTAVNSVVSQNVVKSSEENIVSAKSENVQTRVQVVTKSPVLSTVVEVRSKDEVPGVKNNLAEPEYDFLSKQPTEVIDETYKLINLKPSSKNPAKPRPTSKREKENPTGLVTKLGGTIVKDGLTTVHETSVLGTYINGKYAQVLQSSSRILNAAPAAEGKIRPSSSQRILKTIGPQHGKLKPQLEPTPTAEQEESSLPLEVLFSASAGPNVRTTRRHTGSHPSRPKFRNKIIEDYESNETPQQRATTKNRPTTARPGYKNRQQTTTTTTTTAETPVTRRRSGFRPSNQPSLLPKQIKSKNSNDQITSNPLPKVQQDDDELRQPTVTADDSSTTETANGQVAGEDKPSGAPANQRKNQFDEELDSSESEDVVSTSVQEQSQTEQIVPVETLNVEISTAADQNDVYYEIATIKSPYSFQVGSVRNTRFITVTSTIKKSFATQEPSLSASNYDLSASTEPLTENILANTGAAYESTLPLDSSVATLPAISLEAGQVTPPLETLTETFSTTQTLLKTHMLPVISGDNTTKITLVQTYHISRVVTATKTLPPMEIYQFIPSKTLNEFNSKLDEAGSELHLELDFGDEERDDEDIPKRVAVPNSDLESDLIFKSVSPSKVKPASAAPPSAFAEQQLSPEKAQQLALLKYFGQQGQPQVITTSRPVVVLETVYESHVIPIVNGGNTLYSTLSRPVGTVPRTSYEYGTSTIAPILPQQQPQVPQVPLFPQQQPQFTVTSVPLVTQTLATVSDSRVLKLTFGAKTAYTTLFSTRVVPTDITTYLTSTVPVQPTIPAFPGYFPPPVGYPPFPFVG